MDAGTRLISIRRADVKQTAVADLQSNTAYIQSAADRYVISVNSGSSPAFAPANATGFNLQGTDGISPIRQYHVLIYYLSNQTLMVWDASSNSTPQPVVDGIENMQIEYGIDQNNDGSPDSYSCSPTTAQDMSNTVTVGLHLLARSTEIDPSHTDTRTYNLGCLTVGAKNDHYRRRVFSQVVGLTNVIRRRE
jgi:type IV pilus assembly protein PilW